MQVRFQRLQAILLALILSIMILSSTGCERSGAAGSSGGSGEIAARVGNVDIPLSKVDRIIEQGLKGQTDKKLSDLTPVELAAARLQALDTLITDEVLYQRAKQENIQVSDEEVRSEIQKGIQADGLSEDDFQKRLKEFGLTSEEFNQEQRRRMMVAKLQDKISIVKPPTDREISDFYKRNEAQYKIGKGISLSTIMVDAANNNAKNDAIGEDQAKQKIDTIFTQLKSGADFATVARIQSEDLSAKKGGDLGFLDENSLQQLGFPNELVQLFFNMREGDITPVMKVGNGKYAIFKLTAKRTQEEKLTLDSPQVKAQISQTLTGQRKEILNSALLTTATYQVRIENLLAQRMLQNPDNFGSLRPTTLSDGQGSKPSSEATPDANKPAESSKPADTNKPADNSKPADGKGASSEPAKDGKSSEAGK